LPQNPGEVLCNGPGESWSPLQNAVKGDSIGLELILFSRAGTAKSCGLLSGFDLIGVVEEALFSIRLLELWSSIESVVGWFGSLFSLFRELLIALSKVRRLMCEG